MDQQDRDTLKGYFEKGDRPTEGHFSELIDSFVNKVDDGITVSSSSKNIGIGTNDPQVKLDVDGDIKSSGNLTASAEVLVGTNLTVGSKLTVEGNMEVKGEMVVKQVEYHEGDVQLGNDAKDKVSVYGFLQGESDSKELKIKSPLKVTGDINATENLTIAKELTVQNDVLLGSDESHQVRVAGSLKVGETDIIGALTELSASTVNKSGDNINGNLLIEGNVGVGVSSPETQLHVNEDIKAGGTVTGTTITAADVAGTKNAGAIQLINSTSGNNWNAHIRSNNEDKLFFIGHDKEKNTWKKAMVLTLDGKVGIGRLSPGAQLHVNEDIEAGGTVTGTTLKAEDEGTAKNAGAIILSNSTSGNNWNAHIRSNNEDKLFFIGHDKEKNTWNKTMVLTLDGKVGIGRLSPEAQLHVNEDIEAGGTVTGTTLKAEDEGTAKNAGAIILSNSTSGNNWNAHIRSNNEDKLFFIGHDKEKNTWNKTMVLTLDGKVGIGTTAPKATVHIRDLSLETIQNLQNPEKYHLLIQGSATKNSGSGIAFGSADAVGAAILHIEKGSKSKGDIAFYTKQTTEDEAPVEAMRIDAKGNVGIGISELISEKLDVAGVIKATAFVGDGSGLTGVSSYRKEQLPITDKFIINADNQKVPLQDYSGIYARDLVNGIKIVFDSNAELKLNSDKCSCQLIVNKPTYFTQSNNYYNYANNKKTVGYIPFVLRATVDLVHENSILIFLTNQDIDNLATKLFYDTLIHIKIIGKLLNSDDKEKYEDLEFSLQLTPEVRIKDYRGSYGTGDGQFQWSPGIAIDKDQNLYVIDYNQNRIQKFNNDGDFTKTLGAPGSGDGQFKYPQGIAVDKSGMIYVADTSNHRVQIFRADLTFVKEWVSYGDDNDLKFNYPRHIAVDNQGFVYVVDSNNSGILQFTTEGEYVRTIGSPGNGDGQFAYVGKLAANKDKVYIVDPSNQRIVVFKDDGAHHMNIVDLGDGDGYYHNPQGIAVDSSGNIYVVDSSDGSVQKFDAEGKHIVKWGSKGNDLGQFIWPHDVEVDDNGIVYVLDQYHVVSFEFPINE